MSVVAVKVSDNYIEIASDSLVTEYNSIQKEMLNCKLYKIADNFVIGGVGYLKDLSLLKMYATDHYPSDNKYKSIFTYMSDYIEYIRKYYSNYSPEHSSYYIIYNGVCYMVDGGFDIVEIDDIHSIGSGLEPAYACLLMGSSIKKAIEIASQVNPYCGGEITYYKIKR